MGINKSILFILALAVFGIAIAQGATAPALSPDIGAWFASTAALAVVVGAIVAFLKKHTFRTPRASG